MSELDESDELDAASAALWRTYLTPPRRDEPRIAPILHKADFEEIQTQTGRIATWRWGNEPAVVLLLGFGDDHTLWAPLMERLVERNISFVTLDLPGHGLSGGSEIALRLAANTLWDVVKARGPISAVVGHSLGGLATALALAEGLQLERVVIIATARHRRRRLIGLAEAGHYPARIIQRVRELHAARFGDRDMDMNIPDLAGSIKTPALFIHSVDDESVPYADSVAAHDAWQGSKIRLTQGLSHRRSARDPDTLTHILEFLQKDSRSE